MRLPIPTENNPIPQRRVLILCTGNSCRSQMAEGLINHFLGETWSAASAGTLPAGYVHPLAIEAMAELGVDISTNRSKSTDEFRGQHFDLVVTVCDDAAENCPVWLGHGVRKHLGFPDPAKATGTPDEIRAEFRKSRESMREVVLEFVNQFA